MRCWQRVAMLSWKRVRHSEFRSHSHRAVIVLILTTYLRAGQGYCGSRYGPGRGKSGRAASGDREAPSGRAICEDLFGSGFGNGRRGRGGCSGLRFRRGRCGQYLRSHGATGRAASSEGREKYSRGQGGVRTSTGPRPRPSG